MLDRDDERRLANLVLEVRLGVHVEQPRDRRVAVVARGDVQLRREACVARVVDEVVDPPQRVELCKEAGVVRDDGVVEEYEDAPVGRAERLVRVDVQQRPRDDEVPAAHRGEERGRPRPDERHDVHAVLQQLRDARAVAEVCRKAQRRVPAAVRRVDVDVD